MSQYLVFVGASRKQSIQSCSGNFIRNKQLLPAVFGLTVNTNAKLNLYLVSVNEGENCVLKREVGCYDMKKENDLKQLRTLLANLCNNLN